MHNEIKSPISDSLNVKLFEVIPSSLIIEKYQEDLDIDVKRFFNSNKVEIYECLDTGLLFYYPYDTVGDEKLYKDLQDKGTYYSIWNWEHDAVYDIIKTGNKVLEVGCGTGSFLEKLKEDRIEAYGLELNNKAVNVCKQKGLNVYNELLEDHVEKVDNFYDVVCSFQVLEHTLHIKSYIDGCLRAAKKGGLIIFGVPNNNPFIFKRDKYHTLNLPPHHMSLWSRKAFQKLPGYFDMALVNITVEELYNKRYYLNTFLKYKNLNFVKKITNHLPDTIINSISKFRNWQGRNIVAIFKKN